MSAEMPKFGRNESDAMEMAREMPSPIERAVETVVQGSEPETEKIAEVRTRLEGQKISAASESQESRVNPESLNKDMDDLYKEFGKASVGEQARFDTASKEEKEEIIQNALRSEKRRHGINKAFAGFGPMAVGAGTLALGPIGIPLAAAGVLIGAGGFLYSRARYKKIEKDHETKASKIWRALRATS